MRVRAKIAGIAAGILAAITALAVALNGSPSTPRGLTQGGGTVDVFVGSTPTPVTTPTATPTATPFTTADRWVDGAGSCAATSGGVYVDASACATVDAGWDAVSAGGRVCIKAGTYGTQIVSGNKASETTITGNCGGAVTIGPGAGTVTCTGLSGPGADATFCPDGNNMTLDTVTIAVGSANDISSGARINATNTTFRDVNITGNAPQVYVTATGFLWQRGFFGKSGGYSYTCAQSGQPTQIDSGSMTLDGIYWYPRTVTVGAANSGNCGSDGTPHLEYTRIQCNCPVTIKNSFYAPGGEPGSGYIFSGITALNDLVLANNYFADTPVSNYMQAGNLTSCTGWLALYNTFDNDSTAPGFSLGSCDGGVSVGNLGPSTLAQSCSNHIKNVISGSGTCGTDTRIGSADLGVDSSTGRLEVGSPGIDGGETAPGTYCGGAVVAGLDREGGTRGTGGVCDAGADER